MYLEKRVVGVGEGWGLEWGWVGGVSGRGVFGQDLFSLTNKNSFVVTSLDLEI